ncbi:MAG: hypothetical protein ABIH76_02310 [Candidatus Bathyarchaeota archaeon]
MVKIALFDKLDRIASNLASDYVERCLSSHKTYQYSIEQIVRKGIEKGEYIDNVVFQLLKLEGVNDAKLQEMIQDSDYEEKTRILERAVQVWERRQELAAFLAEKHPTYKRLSYLKDMMKQQIEEDDVPIGWGSNCYFYAQAFELIDRFWQNGWKPRRVLDVGSGFGTLLHFLRIYGYEAVGLERDHPFATVKSEIGLTIYGGNILSLPQQLRDQTFSITVSTAMLDAFYTDGPPIREGCRIEDYRELFLRLMLLTELNGLSIHVHALYPRTDHPADYTIFIDSLCKTCYHIRHHEKKNT